ncbi:MAG: hypothetical protein AAGD33_15000 [Actinomycetota bacterium]
MRSSRVVSVAVAATLVVASCGDDGDEASDTVAEADDSLETAEGEAPAESADDIDPPASDEPPADDPDPESETPPSSGSLNAADQALADAIAADLSAEDDDDLGFSEVFDTQCMAEGTVLALGGAEAIEAEYGVTSETVGQIDDTPLSEEDARAVASAYGECGDFVELFVRSFSADGFTEEQSRCLLDGVGNERFEDFIAANFAETDAGAAQDALFSVIIANAPGCGIEF